MQFQTGALEESFNVGVKNSVKSLAGQSYKCGLYVVSTPIGNMGDITLRALWVLMLADEIYCENTRTTANLLMHYGVQNKKLLKFTDHATQNEIDAILTKLKTQKIAMVSEAGTPLICDPGQNLVKQARDGGINVFAINGCSAPIAALSVCGVQCENFVFCGFFDKKRFESIILQSKNFDAFVDAFVFFDNAKSLPKSLEHISKMLGKTTFSIKICLELTKINERVYCLNFGDKLPALKGELVCILHNFCPAEQLLQGSNQQDPQYIIQNILSENKFMQNLSTADKIEFLQKFYKPQITQAQITKKELYEILLEMKD